MVLRCQPGRNAAAPDLTVKHSHLPTYVVRNAAGYRV